MSVTEPLAKTTPPQTLREHTQEVWEAAEAMGHALQLPPPLMKALRDAVWLHDVGKIADGFQQMLQGGQRWGYRHELLSAAVALAAGCPEDVVLAIATHHRALNDKELGAQSGLHAMESVWQKHGVSQWRSRLREMETWWTWLSQFLEQAGYAPLSFSPAELPSLRDFLFRFSKSALKQSPDELREKLTLLRGVLIAADHLASGHHTVPPPLKPPQWNYSWYPFQQQMSGAKGDVLLEAPTGSGKTEASLLWAMHNRQGEARIFYMLPTQASINAMVERLRRSEAFGEEAVAPLHARVLQQEFQQRYSESDYLQAAQEARARTDLYRQFYAPVKVLTPFQIIKHLFGQGYFEVGLAELRQALIIVDEVHAYDARVQALLETSLRYLREEFGIRACFMSATFPSFLKERLRHVVPHAVEISAYGEPRFGQPRHRLRVLDAPLEECIHLIREDLSAGKRVLVVCNRVEQAQAVYQQLDDIPSRRLLHARFTYRDRATIERQVLDKYTQPQLLVATQAVEVSLDISYDTCYTELAPVDDLLQRFGRVNRAGKADEPALVWVCAQYDADRVKRIYDIERLQRTLEHAPDGQELHYDAVLEWLEKVYASGWTEKEQRIYQDTLSAMLEVLSDLTPLYEAEHCVDFDSLFDTVEVLPSCLQEEYLRRVTAKEWLRAHELLVPLRYGTFQGLKSNGLIERAGEAPVVLLDYDSQLGLLPREHISETWIV
ncbi:MAG: CRISPR-associated helicase/endonuclease Cas3 [Armatimonadota bacterium]|nr:MAG: CRISPR-associated helicase/endonuclease Cas3 [Armatimonadota bacterium]